MGGIEGYQAYSTHVVTESLTQAFQQQGLTPQMLILKGIPVPKVRPLKWGIEFMLRYLIYPLWCRRKISKSDLVYVTDHANAGVINLLESEVSTVVHCHDLTSLRPMDDFPYPVRFRNRLINMFSRVFKRRGILKADRIVAISNFTRKELINYLGVSPDRIIVAHLGVDHKVFFPMPKDEARAILNLPLEDFGFMTVGPDSYRKNLIVVANMVKRFAEEDERFFWLHVGVLEDRATRVLAAENLSDKLIVCQGLANHQMRAAYSAVDVFLFPSLYEGFGLPPVEAMACGTPVVAARSSAIPEILGDAALYADAQDHNEILSHCRRLAVDSVLGKSLREKGFEQAKKFDWNITAQTVIRFLKPMGYPMDTLNHLECEVGE